MPNSSDKPLANSPSRHGVVAVCQRAGKFLVIRRSEHVEAPGAFCFPGGGIEDGETEEAALRREMREELACNSTPQARLWRSTTDWNVHLAWWRLTLPADVALTPNPQEVAEVLWLSEDEMRAAPRLLNSNLAFLDARRDGLFELS
jgi:8-oxo-dGTP pyrophosphatase MutT (NUDIX family)